MKFLFVTLEALITDIAWRLHLEGHDVKYFIKSFPDKEIGDGFVPKVDHWEAEVDWADVIIFDDVLGQGAKATELRKKGKLVVGGTAYTDKLEDDRTFGQNQLKGFGISIIPNHEFTDFDEAVLFVQQNPGRYVIKPSGDAQNVKGFLFVGQEDDGKDVIQMLNIHKKAHANKIKVFQLQKRVAGVEVAVGAFFNGKHFMHPINVNFEHKKLFPGEKGPSTGEMGTSMFWSAPNKVFNSTLKKMEEKLAEEGYVGYIDLNCIVNNNGIYPLEFTARFGYPTIFIQHEGIMIPMGEFFHGMAAGTMSSFKTKSGFQVGLRIVVPPFPFKDKKTFDAYGKDTAILFKKDNKEGVHFEDVKKVNGDWMLTGESGVALVVVGCGQTMKQAQKQMYKRVENILIPNMYYRTDIGNRWFEDSDKLHNWGYLREN
jgi:phosphoribosylamine--glycine ligase